MKYWLMKSEPEVFSIEDLKQKKESLWDGVRNYQARNFMRDDMKAGDQVLFYHSNAAPSGVAGLAVVTSEVAEPDPSQFDKKSEYFDPKATKKNPRWQCVRVGYVESFPHVISLDELRQHKELADMPLFHRSRLSIQPVTKKQFLYIVRLAKRTLKKGS